MHRSRIRVVPLACAALLAGLPAPATAQADGAGAADVAATIERWVASEFRPSTLPPEEERRELAWFAAAAGPLRGTQLRVISDTTLVHEYEAKVLAVAFEQITGIHVDHALLTPEGLAAEVEAPVAGSPAGAGVPADRVYDGAIVDADRLGSLLREGTALDLDAWRAGEARGLADPQLDEADLTGREAGLGPDGHLYLLPDQRSLDLYWFRHDWFADPRLQARFKARYGYELGVPLDWRAYGDIAGFFSRDVTAIEGETVHGHLGPAVLAPRAGEWRAMGALLAAGGVARHGLALDGCRAVGAGLAHGGQADGPAAAATLAARLAWAPDAPPDATTATWYQVNRLPGTLGIAQAMPWDSMAADALIRAGSPVMAYDGTALWRVAPLPHGPGWRPSSQPGLPAGTAHVEGSMLHAGRPVQALKAAWLYEQFIASRTVSLRKAHVGLSFIRGRDLADASVTARAGELGGLVELLRSPVAASFQAGSLVPDYAAASTAWASAAGQAARGGAAPAAALTGFAAAWDADLGSMAKQKPDAPCAPRPGSPSTATPLPTGGTGHTISYESLLASGFRTGG